MTQAFNLSQLANKVNSSGQADLTTAVTGTLPVANGGTGAATLTSGNVLIGAGTSAVTFVAAGTTGNVLTSNGTTWTSAAATGGQLQTEIFTAPGTWTKPASCTKVRVIVVGGGGGANGQPGNFRGGQGGVAMAECPVSSPVSITIGAGGVGTTFPSGGATSGGTSSFGPLVSATGGGAGTVSNTAGTTGTGTVSTGTVINVSPGAIVSAILVGAGKNTTRGGSAPLIPATPYTVPGNDYRAGAIGSNGTPNTTTPGGGGVGGAIAIEYVG